MINDYKIEKEMVSEEPEDSVVSDEGNKEYKISFIRLMFKAGIPALMLICMIINMLSLGFKALTPVLLMESYENLTPQIANALNIILIVGSPIGTFIAKSRFLQKINAVGVIALFLALSLPLVLIVIFAGKVNLILVMLALLMLMITVGVGGTFFLRISLGFEKYGKTGTLSGMFNSMAALGIVFANYLFAKIAELYGWGVTTMCWFLITAFSLVLTIIVIPVWKKFEKNN